MSGSRDDQVQMSGQPAIQMPAGVKTLGELCAGPTAPRADLTDFRPVERIAPSVLTDSLCEAGFHGARQDYRQGMSALAFRQDVTMRDLCETITARLRALRGVLSLIEVDEDTPLHVTQAAEAALMLANEAAGFHEVLFQGVLHYGRDAHPSQGERSSP